MKDHKKDSLAGEILMILQVTKRIANIRFAISRYETERRKDAANCAFLVKVKSDEP